MRTRYSVIKNLSDGGFAILAGAENTTAPELVECAQMYDPTVSSVDEAIATIESQGDHTDTIDVIAKEFDPEETIIDVIEDALRDPQSDPERTILENVRDLVTFLVELEEQTTPENVQKHTNDH